VAVWVEGLVRGERGRRRRVGHAALPDRCACGVHHDNVFAVDTRRQYRIVGRTVCVTVPVLYIRASVRRRTAVVGFSRFLFCFRGISWLSKS